MSVTPPRNAWRSPAGFQPRQRLDLRHADVLTPRPSTIVISLVLGNLALALALLMGIYMAVAWGELSVYDVNGDKSGLAGLGAVVLFMGMRWLSIAGALLLTAWRGGLEFLPGNRWAHAGIAIAAHAALGYLSYKAFDWIVAAIQRSDASPLGSAWVFGIVLPVIVLLALFAALNRSWIPRHPVWTAIVVAVVLWAHIGPWRQGTGSRKPPVPAEAR